MVRMPLYMGGKDRMGTGVCLHMSAKAGLISLVSTKNIATISTDSHPAALQLDFSIYLQIHS